MGAVIELKNVTYHYPMSDAPAVKNINLEIEAGKICGIIGENGSGKTTLCCLIRGFAPGFYRGKLDGEALLFGKPVDSYGADELAARVGYVFQNPFNQLSGVRETLFEEVAFCLENLGVPVDKIERRVEEAMRLTDIWELADKNPFNLSGGQLQRAALASAIAPNPDVIVLDEPTSQLDPEGADGVFRIISEMKKAGKTIVIAEHRTDHVAEHADMALVLHGGELVRSGPSEDVLGDMSLKEYGVRLPSVVALGAALCERGLKLPHVPVTESRCVEVLRGLMGRSG